MNGEPPIGSENTVLIMQYFRVALKVGDKIMAAMKSACAFSLAMIFEHWNCSASQASLPCPS
jgi:hypothetical protein